MKKTLWTAIAFSVFSLMACSKKGTGGGGTTPPPVTPPVTPPVVLTNDVEFWMTKADQSVLLEKQSGTIGFTTVANSNQDLLVDSAERYQSIDGFGYTLTSGSATLINNLTPAIKAGLLQDLFSSTGIGVSYLRISIGASDLSANVYSYDDVATGQTDLTLASFTLNPDKAGGTGLIPLLKEILLINPNIKILACPWSPPVWMKDNGQSIGGSLLPTYYPVYAQYFVKYIQQMQAEGVKVDAITPQNEPLNPGNNPSLLMTAVQQRDFIKTNLGPAFQTAGLTTKIIIWDHNCDNAGYPISILNDAAAKTFIDGSAFHLYAGDISAMSSVHSAHPDKNLYFTEQYTPSNGGFDGDLKWHLKNVIIGSMRNWSRNALEWNLANDASFGPHTNGGCTTCKGALTVLSTSAYTKNVAYYIIAQISKFVPPGSVRVGSSQPGTLWSAAFERPDKKKVMVILNDGAAAQTFNIKFNGKWAAATLPANSAGTYIW